MTRPLFGAIAAMAALGLSLSQAEASHGQPSETIQGRIGPNAQPPPLPPYAIPRVILPSSAQTPEMQSAEGTGQGLLLSEDRIAGVGTRHPARPRHRWRPRSGQSGSLRLDIKADEAMDTAWARRQFVLNKLIGAPTSADRVVSLVLLINQAFVQNGYINTGILFDQQDWPQKGGVLYLRLVKGRLIPPRSGQPAITITWAKGGAHGLRKSFVRDRMPAAAQSPLNAFDIEQDFRLLADDPAIHAVDAKLSPGGEPGEANLVLTVSPQPRFDVYATVANSRSPSVGGIRYSGGATRRNAIFSGDLLSIEGGETSGLADGTVAYSTPFFTPSTFVDVRGLIDQAAVLDQAVRALCRSRALASVRTRSGWEIDADSAAGLAARRKGAER